MSRRTASSGSSGRLLLGGAVLLLGVGVAVWKLRAPDVAAPLVSDATVQRAAIASSGTDDAAPAVKDALGDAGQQAPQFDEVRREPDGLTVVAGRAAPGSDVRLLLDGVEIGKTQADETGGFAAVTSVGVAPQAQVLALEQELGGTRVLSRDDIILAPLAVVPVDAPVALDAPVVADAPVPSHVPDPLDDIAAATLAPQAPKAGDDETLAGNETPMAAAGTTDAPDETAEAAFPGDTAPDVAAPLAPKAPSATGMALLRSTPAGVELLPARVPAVMSAVALDTISYSQTGDVHLAGRAMARQSEVRVYLDNRAVATLAVDAQGRWRGELPDVDTGIYTLRVDEISRTGKVTSRVETPFKRESRAVLSRATAKRDGPVQAITVQKGATLWAIARDRYGDPMLYVRVFAANAESIRDPDLIYPGQVFDLPE